MKPEEIKEMTTADLRERLEQMQKEYRQLVATHAVSTVDNPAQITKNRRMIARVLTELRARELAAK
ncbi:MAG: 50S ribosomal protein L29 [Muribaculaceae bacterium]|nr:50S ribosomal protein L29 [Muribaculaceae bacterium]MDE6509361.1 50S ribosomal protein L29 [Muribaculaceae bacterium]